MALFSSIVNSFKKAVKTKRKPRLKVKRKKTPVLKRRVKKQVKKKKAPKKKSLWASLLGEKKVKKKSKKVKKVKKVNQARKVKKTAKTKKKKTPLVAKSPRKKTSSKRKPPLKKKTKSKIQPKQEDIGEPAGLITHYFSKIGVVVLKVIKGHISVGDTIRIKGASGDFIQKVNSLQIESVDVKVAKKGQLAGLKVNKKVREGDKVYLEKK